ncbi:MAG: alpha-2-macroglobulin family protein, partial [Clostridiales bacterium]
DGIRKDFADTADFISVNSNSKGEASVKVHFPDNLTSWRISSLAISSDVKAGYAKENIQVGRDFFIHPLISANYLEGDDLAFSLRSFGKKANNQQDVNYTISMTGPKGEQKINLQGKPDQYIQGNLGKMPKGQYKIVFTAQQGENKDAIEKTVNISDTLLEIPVWEKTTPEKLKDLQVNKYPVNLLLYDSQNELYFSALSQLWQEGSRADQQLAKQLALDKLQKTAQGDLQLTDNYNPQSIQPFSGGIILLPYSEEDPLLTAKACAVAGPYIDTDLAKNYFSNIVNHSLDAETAKNRKIDYNKLTAAYFGLAALKEPVLDDIQDLLNNAPNLDFEQKLNLALGLAYIGDSQTASAWYDANISPLLIEQKPWKYLKKGEDQDYNYYLTGQALMLAVKINHPDTEALLTYLLDNKSDKYLVLMEIMSYVNLFDSAPTPAAYSYNLNGENTKGDFHENSYLTLSLGEKQLKEANIQATKGEIGIRAFYNGKLSAVEKDKSASLSLEKSLQADNLQTGNGVKINFHIKFAP